MAVNLGDRLYNHCTDTRMTSCSACCFLCMFSLYPKNQIGNDQNESESRYRDIVSAIKISRGLKGFQLFFCLPIKILISIIKIFDFIRNYSSCAYIKQMLSKQVLIPHTLNE